MRNVFNITGSATVLSKILPKTREALLMRAKVKDYGPVASSPGRFNLAPATKWLAAAAALISGSHDGCFRGRWLEPEFLGCKP